MILNHLDLQVADVQATVSTFEAFFGLTLETSRNSPAIAIMSDGHGFTLVLQRSEAPQYPAGFHLGFLVESIAIVERTHARLVEAGASVTPVQSNNRGTMIYCQLPHGIVVEVSCRRVS